MIESRAQFCKTQAHDLFCGCDISVYLHVRGSRRSCVTSQVPFTSPTAARGSLRKVAKRKTRKSPIKELEKAKQQQRDCSGLALLLAAKPGSRMCWPISPGAPCSMCFCSCLPNSIGTYGQACLLKVCLMRCYKLYHPTNSIRQNRHLAIDNAQVAISGDEARGARRVGEMPHRRHC